MKTWFSTNTFANLAHNARTAMHPNPTTNPRPRPPNLRKFPLPTPPTRVPAQGLVRWYFNYPRPQCTPIWVPLWLLYGCKGRARRVLRGTQKHKKTIENIKNIYSKRKTIQRNYKTATELHNGTVKYFRYNNKPSVAHCTSSKERIYVLQTLKTIRSVRTQQAQRSRGFLFPLWTLHGRAVYLCHESARGSACVYTNLRKSWFCIEVGDN